MNAPQISGTATTSTDLTKDALMTTAELLRHRLDRTNTALNNCLDRIRGSGPESVMDAPEAVPQNLQAIMVDAENLANHIEERVSELSSRIGLCGDAA